MDQITRTCSLILLSAAALTAVPAAAKPSDFAPGVEAFLYAQRAELAGKTGDAVLGFNRALSAAPTSKSANDRLFATAVRTGDFTSVMKAARSQQLANSGNAGLPLILFVDAWRRKDWEAVGQANVVLRDSKLYGFMAPLLDAWANVAQGKPETLGNAIIAANPPLGYYSDDQLIWLELARGQTEQAKEKLLKFAGYGDAHGRHLALGIAPLLAVRGEGEFATALLRHVGQGPLRATGKPPKDSSVIGNFALATLFSRLSDQLSEQKIYDQALLFARIAGWLAPESGFGKLTLADRLASDGQNAAAITMLSSIKETSPYWTWAVSSHARLLAGLRRHDEALKLMTNASARNPNAGDLVLQLAILHGRKGDHKSASGIYRVLVAKVDAGKDGSVRQRVLYRLMLADALDKTGDWPATRAILEEALTLDENEPQSLNMLGYGLLERREDVARGFELVEKAHRLSPESAAIMDSLGWGYFLTGSADKAIPLLEAATQNAIDDSTINEHLGDAYWQYGRRIDARYAWRAAALSADGEGAKRLATKIDLGWTEETAAN